MNCVAAHPQEMAAAAKAVSPKPFVSSGHLGRTFSADAFLSQAASATAVAAAAKEEAAGAKRSSTAVKAWRSGGPPKTVRLEGPAMTMWVAGLLPGAGFQLQTSLLPWAQADPPPPRMLTPQGAAFCVFSQVGRDFVPDPVREAKVSSLVMMWGCLGCAVSAEGGGREALPPRGLVSRAAVHTRHQPLHRGGAAGA